jgi:anti-anti-sigma factor
VGLRVSHLPVTAATRTKLRVEAGEAGGPAVLELEGEFDLDTVPEIDPYLRRTLGPLYHQDHLVIDLARTTFIDSSFVAFLMRLSAAQRSRRRELLLVRPTGQVRRVLAIVGLPNIVPVFDTTEAAVASVMGCSGPVIPPLFTAAGEQGHMPAPPRLRRSRPEGGAAL